MENISVSVRVRPLNKQEGQEFFSWKIDGNTIVQLDSNTRDIDRTRDTKYGLDHVFGPDWTTARIYEVTTQSLIHKMVNGFNSTVFAYGQTSSGKTHTMRGSPDSPGLVPLAVEEAFRLIESNVTREYLIRVSYMELYNEEVNDLLAPENVKLPIHESKENGPYVCGLREDIVTSPEQVLQLLESGEANRHIGSTKMNDTSSRSHTIFRMVVESRSVDADSSDAGAVLVSVLTLVDLAGSERVAKTGAEGIRMKEGTAINKSLLTLGNVINKLSEGALATGSHIPYRDSKLTRILQPSLGGNAKTSIICAMTPAACHLEESHSTLRFACRAKRIVNNAVVNEVLSDAAVLKRQAKEIEELRMRLAESGAGAFVEEQINVLRAQLLRSEQEKELMRVTLQVEQAEREKAQKQAEMAKKLMFQQRDDSAAEGTGRKQNRRETWCPGKSAWAAPPGLAELETLAETPTHSGSGTEGSTRRKRSFGRLDGAQPSKINAELSALLEEDEEEDDDVAEGPTPQRRRRERSSAPSDGLQEEEDEEDGGMGNALGRIMAALPSQERDLLDRLVQQWDETDERVAGLQQEVERLQQVAAQHEESATSNGEALDAALRQKSTATEQLEQAKWHSRQLDKKVADLQAACRSVEQERAALIAAHAAQQAAADAEAADLRAKHQEVTDDRSALREQLKAIKAELLDTRAKLELRDYEAGLREAKDEKEAREKEDLSVKMREKVCELEALRRDVEAANERVAEVEERARELYECNKRLEIHIGELESRKRAPLYQKKQEEELKAAVEKAQTCEIRALDAELRAKEMRADADAAEKRAAELKEELEQAVKKAARMQEELQEQHAVEMQRLNLESVRQQERHEEAMQGMQAALQELEAAKASLAQSVQVKDQRICELEQQIIELQARVKDLEATEVELQAYTAAAQEKISSLEQRMEEETAAHEQALNASDQAREEALATASTSHDQAMTAAAASYEEAKTVLETELVNGKATAAATVAQLEADLKAAHERADFVVKASIDQSAEASAAKAELQRQVDELSAKVQEAAGALKAKEELKEEKMRSKQEIATLKGELQKLQLESKTGAKGKDMAQKELDAVKKRLTDAEGKLRVALQDKASAVQEKGNLERQLKQFQSQKLMIEKTLEKKDAIENKKRESIMVNLHKSKEQINTFEERLKLTTIELQKVQMDLMAKQSECHSLEEQLAEQQGECKTLRDEAYTLALEGTELRHQLECALEANKEVTGQLQVTSSELADAQAASGELTAKLDAVSSELYGVKHALSERDSQVQSLQAQHQLATEQHDEAVVQLSKLQDDHTGLVALRDQLQSALEAAQANATAAETAYKAVEAKQPILDDLQQQLSLANENLAAARSELERLSAEATGQQEAARAEVSELHSQLCKAQDDEGLLRAKYSAAQELIGSLQTQLAESSSHHALMQSTLAAAEEQHSQLLVQLQQAASKEQGLLEAAQAEIQQLRLQLGSAEAELQQLSSQLSHVHQERQEFSRRAEAAESQIEQLVEQLAAAKAAMQHLSEQITTYEAEIELLRTQLGASTAEAQRLAAEAALRQQAASSDQETLTSQLCDAEARILQLSGELVATKTQLSATEQASASDRERIASDAAEANAETQRLSGLLAAAECECQCLAGRVAAMEQTAAADCERASALANEAQADMQRLHSQLHAAELEVQRLTSQLSATETEARQCASQLREAEAEVRRVFNQSQAYQREAETSQLQAMAGTESLNQLRGRIAELEEALAREQAVARASARPPAPQPIGTTPAEAHTRPVAGEDDDTADLLSSPAPGPLMRASPTRDLRASLQQLREQAASEVANLSAALATAHQHVDSLEAELNLTRSQLAEARMTAVAAKSNTDMTRSLSALPGMTSRLQVTELQLQLDQLNQELTEMEFSMSEERAAAASEQQLLKAQLAAAGEEATARRQQADAATQRAGDLERRCTDLVEELAAARKLYDVEAEQTARLRLELEAVHVAAASARVEVQLASERTQTLAQQLAASADAEAQVTNASARIAELEANLAEAAARQTTLETQLATALAAQEELACDLAAQTEQRDQLLRIIDELSVQVASAPSNASADGQLDELRGHLAQREAQFEQLTQELTAAAAEKQRLSALLEQMEELQASVDRNHAALHLAEVSRLQHEELHLQHCELQTQHTMLQQQAAHLQAQLEARAAAEQQTSASLAKDTEAVHPDASVELMQLRRQVAELHQRQAELEAEMSDVQAACNVALAEKRTLEQESTHRVLELETANIRLQDQLAAFRGEQPGSAHAVTPKRMPAFDLDALLADKDRLQGQVAELSAALANAHTAREAAIRRLEAELDVARETSAHLSSDMEASTVARQALQDEKQRAEGRAAMLEDALNSATASRGAADAESAVRAAEAEGALSALLLRYDELLLQMEQARREACDNAADADTLRAGLAAEAEKRKTAEEGAEREAIACEGLRQQLQCAQDAASNAATIRVQLQQRFASAAATAEGVSQLQLQVSALEATVARLEKELAVAKEAAASSELELQELLDANTLLESQMRDVRTSHAALQARASSEASSVEQATAALATQLRESEALRSRLEQQVLDLTEQMGAASAARCALANERAELEDRVRAEVDARNKLEAQLAALDKACKDLREENQSLDEELQAAQEQLHSAASDGRPTQEQLVELQHQLQAQENRHRLAMEAVQEQLAGSNKVLSEQQAAAREAEMVLRQQLEAAAAEVRRVQEAQAEAIDELELSAKQREAELNAEKLSLESQIHWLQEENARLLAQGSAGAAPPPPQPAALPSEIAERLAALEAELRRAKRGEMKLQALLYRLRKDVEAAGGGAAFDNLREVRSLQYDVDMMAEKCKRYAREAQQHDAEKRALQARLEQLQGQQSGPGQMAGAAGVGGKAAGAAPGAAMAPSGAVFVDKENMPYR